MSYSPVLPPQQSKTPDSTKRQLMSWDPRQSVGEPYNGNKTRIPDLISLN